MTRSKRNRSLTLRMCIMCAKPFTSLATLKMHIKVDHAGELKCSLCEVVVENKKNFVRHLQKHKGERQNKTSTKLVAESSTFLCDQCNYTCNQQFQLKNHIERVHSEDRPFVCLYINCNKSYARRGDLKTHEKFTHVKLKKFKCDECEMKFINKTKLRKHVSQVHTLVGDHHCVICKKNYFDNQALGMHIESVHNKLSLACSHCEKGFSWQGNLTRHIKVVH